MKREVPYVAGWGETGALEAVTEFAAVIDSLARRIEEAINVPETIQPPRTTAQA